jgi:hypothetical protein
MRYKFSSAQIFPLVSILMGGLFAVLVLVGVYDFWDPIKGPLIGFYPCIMGVALFVVGIIDLMRSFKDAPLVFTKRNWLLILSVGGVIFLSYIVGLLFATGIFLFLWLKIVEKRNWKSTIIVMLVIVMMVYGVFILWLQVPFERGVLFSWLSRR